MNFSLKSFKVYLCIIIISMRNYACQSEVLSVCLDDRSHFSPFQQIGGCRWLGYCKQEMWGHCQFNIFLCKKCVFAVDLNPSEITVPGGISFFNLFFYKGNTASAAFVLSVTAFPSLLRPGGQQPLRGTFLVGFQLMHYCINKTLQSGWGQGKPLPEISWKSRFAAASSCS